MSEELRTSRMRENELKRHKQEIIVSLSHDLKTPIISVKLICELLSVKVKDEYISGNLKLYNRDETYNHHPMKRNFIV